jgi:SHAQKYF class myb-like DNA-binding protein
VAELGLEQAKPQAIAQIMDLHGENAPTRQNIKSHLQKYRLHMQKRVETERKTADKIDTKSKAPPLPKQGAVRGSS